MTSDHKVDTGDGMSCDNCQNNLSYRTVNTELCTCQLYLLEQVQTSTDRILQTHGDKISQERPLKRTRVTPCGDLLETNKVTCDETTVSVNKNFACCHNQVRCEETTVSNNTDYDCLPPATKSGKVGALSAVGNQTLECQRVSCSSMEDAVLTSYHLLISS